jgi:ubiquinone/menaquinone biosynthesis C-methylase UbiE
MDRDFHTMSYELHSGEYNDYAHDGSKEAHGRTWLSKDTVDAWRHRRMYKVLDPVLEVEPGAKWLTIGDGRYGSDARYIQEKGGSVLASDISVRLLEEAKKAGYIKEFQRENAESLSFDNMEFDYVLCKESYHHFPRPMIALYEMMRVANKGVVLIEPNDPYIHTDCVKAAFANLKQFVKKILGIKVNKHTYEEIGNYAFTISTREIEKVALGINLRTIAIKGINDFYLPGVEFEQLACKGPLFRKVRSIIYITNMLCKIGLTHYGIIAIIIFKQPPSDNLLRKISDAGFEIMQLPANPKSSPV